MNIDKSKLSQVVRNLLSNALQFTHHGNGGLVVVEVTLLKKKANKSVSPAVTPDMSKVANKMRRRLVSLKSGWKIGVSASEHSNNLHLSIPRNSSLSNRLRGMSIDSIGAGAGRESMVMVDNRGNGRSSVGSEVVESHGHRESLFACVTVIDNGHGISKVCYELYLSYLSMIISQSSIHASITRIFIYCIQ